MWWSSVASASSAFMPPAGTEIASQVDSIYAFLLVGSLISFIILIGGMIYFVVKYRRRTPNDKTAYITHNHTLEFLWSFIPFCIFIFAFAWGWIVYHDMRSFPQDALEVHVVAKKWDWRFLYKNGKEVISGVDAEGRKSPATMVVPVGRPIKLIMASEKINPAGTDPTDRPVLHSFFIPAFRVKQDVVPGRYSALWFKPEVEGTFWVFCTEYCGSGHSAMLAAVRVVPVPEFENWLATEGEVGGSLADIGRQLYAQKACIGCHSLDGTRVVGPTFKGLFGRTNHATDKGAVTVDEDYLRESILAPNAKIVAGYAAGIMPVYAGQLSDDEVTALIEFIKTVK
jgi:cytochrome c oxidase subunit II